MLTHYPCRSHLATYPDFQPYIFFFIRLSSLIALLCDRLSYDTWTSILPDKATPAQAQTDLPLGKARIPKNWSLKLVAMPANFLCMLHHDHCHIAVSKLSPFTLITKHHRVARIFWLWVLMTTSCRCEMRPLIWPRVSFRR